MRMLLARPLPQGKMGRETMMALQVLADAFLHLLKMRRV